MPNISDMLRHSEVCEEPFAHEDVIRRVAPDMPEEEDLYDLAELFKLFGDTTRIRILYVLFESEIACATLRSFCT